MCYFGTKKVNRVHTVQQWLLLSRINCNRLLFCLTLFHFAKQAAAHGNSECDCGLLKQSLKGSKFELNVLFRNVAHTNSFANLNSSPSLLCSPTFATSSQTKNEGSLCKSMPIGRLD